MAGGTRQHPGAALCRNNCSRHPGILRMLTRLVRTLHIPREWLVQFLGRRRRHPSSMRS